MCVCFSMDACVSMCLCTFMGRTRLHTGCLQGSLFTVSFQTGFVTLNLVFMNWLDHWQAMPMSPHTAASDPQE